MATAFKNFMEFTEQLGNVVEVGNTLWGFIGKHWKFPTGLDQNVNKLKRKRVELNCRKEDTESRIKAEWHPRKKLKNEVELWLKNAREKNVEIQKLESEALGPSSFYSRGFLRNNVCKRIEEVEDLLEKGKFSDDLFVDDPSRIGQELQTPSLVGETIAHKRDEILGCLMDNEDHKIGIHGMPGVGKTSVIKLVNNRLVKDANGFNIVLWVTVSRRCNVIELQNKIAQAMNAVISEEDETIRAGILSDILGQKGRYVLILDDVWENFSLEEVGIPEPTAGNGSKLVLTCQSLDVCRRMDCRVIKMEPLPQAEAWTLFLKKVGEDLMDHAALVEVARPVAELCAGLPLAIITVASSMKGQYHLPIWRNTFNELQSNVQTVNSDVKDVLFQQLRFSYDCLHDLKIQKCFLTCASYAEDSGIPKEQLIRDWIKRGLINDMGNRQANFDRGQAILRNLVDNCLLENVDNGRVKMHDLVRDMALIIIEELHSS